MAITPDNTTDSQINRMFEREGTPGAIREFDDADAAVAYQRSLGADYYVCAGVTKLYRVLRRFPEVPTLRPVPATFAKRGYFGTLLVEGEIEQAKFFSDLLELGYEAYADCNGDTVIRTVESGDKHRALVAHEEAYHPRTREVGGSRFQPPEVVREHSRDPDEEHSDDFDQVGP